MIKQLNYEITPQEFISLKIQAKLLFIKLINKNRLISINNYLNKYKSEFIDSKEYLDAYKILVEGLNNLIFVVYENKTIIQINPDIYLDYRVTLDSLCRLINNGNLEIKGYNIITQIFERLG